MKSSISSGFATQIVGRDRQRCDPGRHDLLDLLLRQGRRALLGRHRRGTEHQACARQRLPSGKLSAGFSMGLSFAL